MSDEISNINGKHPDRRVNAASRKEKMKVYRSARWQKFRLAFLSRHPLCAGDGCNRLATEVDHRDGDYQTFKDDDFDGYCKACHTRKGHRTGI